MTNTVEFALNNIDRLEHFLCDKGMIKSQPGNYQLLKYTGNQINVTLYSSGKLVFQGKNTENIFSDFINVFDNKIYAHYGSDESGKGDFFGPLVICTTFVSEKNFQILKTMNIIESKKATLSSIKENSSNLKKLIPYEIIKINPEKYNSLYDKIGNLNKLMTWAHTKAIENLTEKIKEKSDIYVDKYASNLNFKIKADNNIIYETHAEKHIAVAAASIIARDEALKWFDFKSKELGITLPRGCSQVKGVARQIVQKHGKVFLEKLCKKSFKTFNELEV